MANRSGYRELQQNEQASECYVCKKKCYSTCSRCGQFYCSKQCQINDWRDQHRYYCFEMPKLSIKSSPYSDDHFSDCPKFHSDNRKMVQMLRSGEHVHEMQSKSSEAADRQSVKSAWTPQFAVFKFGPFPKYNDDVIIIHIRHANSFYIRTCSSDRQYRKNMKDFDDYGADGTSLPSFPRKNDVVLVRHNLKFHRAIVLHDVGNDEEEIEVALVDIGKKITTFFRKMRQLSDELRSRKRYNFIVTLDYVSHGIMPLPFKRLREFVSNRIVFKIQFDGIDWKSAKKIKLLEKDSGLAIERLIFRNESIHWNEHDLKFDKNPKLMGVGRSASSGKAINNDAEREAVSTANNATKPIHSLNTVEELQRSEKPISFVNLATETLPDVAELIILDNTTVAEGFVCAVASKSILKLHELHNKINEYGNRNHEVYAPKPYELCIVKFEEEWNRAIYCESKFLFIDWGNMEVIDERDVRRFPKELNDPCYTFACNIHGAGQELADDPAKIERLKKLLEIQSEHPDCICVSVDGALMEYNVKFPKLLNFFD